MFKATSAEVSLNILFSHFLFFISLKSEVFPPVSCNVFPFFEDNPKASSDIAPIPNSLVSKKFEIIINESNFCKFCPTYVFVNILPFLISISSSGEFISNSSVLKYLENSLIFFSAEIYKELLSITVPWK